MLLNFTFSILVEGIFLNEDTLTFKSRFESENESAIKIEEVKTNPLRYEPQVS